MATNAPTSEGVRRYSVVHFLTALVVLLVTMPFVDQLKIGDVVEAGLITLVFSSAVLAVGGRHRTLIAAIVLVTPALVATWLHHVWPNVMPGEFTLVTAIVFAAFVIVHLLGFVLRSPWVNFEILCAAIAAFLMIGFLGAITYQLVARLVPDSFVFVAGPDANKRSMAGFEALFYSFGTMTPINYGDIMPVSNVARVVTMVQAAIGLFYVTMLIARLVALYTSSPPAPSTDQRNA